MTGLPTLFLVCLPLFSAADTRFALETEDFALQPTRNQVKVGKAGRIYIADTDALTIRVFAPDGAYLFQVGKRGEGPGEFKRWFGNFAIGANGDVYQVDFWGGNRWVNHFDAEGTLIATVNLDALGNMFGPEKIYAQSGERMVLGVGRNWRTSKRSTLYFGSSDSVYYVVDDEGKVSEPLLTRNLIHEISEFPDREGRPIPAQNAFLSAIHWGKEILAFQTSDAAQVNLLHLASGKISKLDHGFARRRVTKEDIEAFVQNRLENFTPAAFQNYERRLYQKMIDHNEKTDRFFPVVSALIFNHEGELFVASEKDAAGIYRIHKMAQGKAGPEFKAKRLPATLTETHAFYLDEDEEEGIFYLSLVARKGTGF